MTIKQHGGIFGRNPTFNDVEAEALGIGGGRTGVVAGVEITTKLCVKDEASGVLAGLVHANNTTAASPAVFYACRSRGTLDSPTVVQDNDQLASIVVAGNDGTDLAIASRIDFEVDGTPGSNDMPGRIVFKTTPDGSQIPADAMEIDSSQNVTVSTGNLVIGTSGQGIDFSATAGTGTSELFDDYEEGAFTPAIDASTTSPSVTYSNQLGRYTKVGNRVHIDIQIQTSAYTAGTGNFRITGLPFTAISGAPEAGSLPMGFKVSTGAEARVKVEGGQTYCQMLSRSARDTSTGWGNAQSSIWANASPTILVVSLTYVVA